MAVALVLPAVSIIGGAPLYIAVPLLLSIVVVGILFDIVGVAVAVAEEAPLHARAAKKAPGAKRAIWLTRNADRVANFCNDMVGDVVGTLSGAAGAAVVAQIARLIQGGPSQEELLSTVTIALVAALTVGGKAAGKSYAMNHANQITAWVGRLLEWWDRRPGRTRRAKRQRGGRTA